MADQEKDQDFGTKCAFSGKRIDRHKRYYRDGKYYLNKNAYVALKEKVAKEAEEAKAE